MDETKWHECHCHYLYEGEIHSWRSLSLGWKHIGECHYHYEDGTNDEWRWKSLSLDGDKWHYSLVMRLWMKIEWKKLQKEDIVRQIHRWIQWKGNWISQYSRLVMSETPSWEKGRHSEEMQKSCLEEMPRWGRKIEPHSGLEPTLPTFSSAGF